ncbi:MAG: CHAT domain-containing protein [Prevotella sp.]|nr:CHAT domain-containing protein [Prevotella sp.]
MKNTLFIICFSFFTITAFAQENTSVQKLNQAVEAANQKEWPTAVALAREALAMMESDADKQECSCILAQLLALQSSDEWNKGDSTVAFTHINEAAELCPGNDFVQLHWQMQHLMKSIGIGKAAGHQEEEKYLKATIERAQALGIANERLRNELSLIYIGYGMAAREKNAYEEAIPWFELAIATADKDSKEWLLAETSLGGTYSSWAQDTEIRTNDFDRVISLSQEAQEHYLIGGKRDRAIKEYSRQAEILSKKGDYNQAVALLQGALGLCGNDSTWLRPKAELHQTLGEMQVEHDAYQQGLAHMEEAYRLFSQEGDGKRCAAVALKMNSIYTYDIKDDEKAEFWLARQVEGLQQSKEVGMPSGTWIQLMPDYLKGMEAIYKKGQPEEGLAIANDLIARANEMEGLAPDRKADFYTMAGGAAIKMKKPAEAEQYFKQALALLEEAGPAGESDLSKVWTFLSNTQQQQGKMEEAVRSSNYAVETAERYFGPTHSTTIDAYSMRANMNGFAGHGDAAAKDIAHCFDIIRDNVMKNFVFMTSEERAAYWKVHQTTIALMPAYAHKLGLWNTPFTTTLYDEQLLSKGLLLSAESALQRTIDASPALRKTYDEIHALKMKAMDGSTPTAEAVAATLEASRKEREMGQAAAEMNTYLNFLNVRAADIRTHLKADEAAVELLDYRVGKDSVMYGALVLRRDWPEARLVPLFEQRQFGNTMDTDIYTNATMTKMVWQPLIDALGTSVKTIYFAPSGQLHQVAIESMCDEQGQPMSERYQLHRMSSTRWLAMSREHHDSHTATLFGGIDYSGYAGSGVTTYTRGAKTGISPLPYTVKEIADIATQLQGRFTVEKREAMEGSEASMQALSSHAPVVLHIATHGFFIDDPNRIPNILKNSLGLTGQETNEELSLKLSGLIFAKVGDDGIVTAAELADYDLSGTDLLVLSACETGLGALKTDGVFGLQRGFKKAGVGSIIMSLWKVDDEATQRMMTLFYDHWLKSGDKRQAFLEAQRTIRKEFPDPLYWAAFILLEE